MIQKIGNTINNLGTKTIKYLGAKRFCKYKVPSVVGQSKKYIYGGSAVQMSKNQFSPLSKKTVEVMRGKEIRSLINILSKSKPQLPITFGLGMSTRLGFQHLNPGRKFDTRPNDGINNPKSLKQVNLPPKKIKLNIGDLVGNIKWESKVHPNIVKEGYRKVLIKSHAKRSKIIEQSEMFYKSAAPMLGSSHGMIAAIVGGSGATGREFIRSFARNNQCGKLYVITRNLLPEWDSDPVMKAKIEIIKLESLDNLSKIQPKLKDETVDVFVSCLGTVQKTGQRNFRKVDYEYPLHFANLGKELRVPHFILQTSRGANPKSRQKYMRIKGEVEEAVKAIGFEITTIARPAMLVGREGSVRIMERLASYFTWFIPSIKTRSLGKAFIERATEIYDKKNEDPMHQEVNEIMGNKKLIKYSKM